MTVSYQAPLEPESGNGRPLTSHVKIGKPSDSLGLCRPPPLIRDLAEVTKCKSKANHMFSHELQRNTESSLLQDSYAGSKVKRKVSCMNLLYRAAERKPMDPSCKGDKPLEKSYGDRKSDKEARENLPRGNTDPCTSPPITQNNPCDPCALKKDTTTDSKGRPCKVCAPDTNSIRKNKMPIRVKSPWKKEKIQTVHRISLGNRINEILNRRPTETTAPPKPLLDLNLLSQIDLDGSAFLIQQLQNIKSDLVAGQKGNPKLNMRDAILVINDLKSKISSLYNTCTNEALSNVMKAETKVKRSPREPVVERTVTKKSKKKGIKILEQAKVTGPILGKTPPKNSVPTVMNVNSPMYSTSNNFSTNPIRKNSTKKFGTGLRAQNKTVASEIEPSATKKLSTKSNLKPLKF